MRKEKIEGKGRSRQKERMKKENTDGWHDGQKERANYLLGHA